MAWKSNPGTLKKNEFATFLDEGTAVEGKFSFTGSVLVNGRLEGEIVSNDTLVVGAKGVVNATIHAGTVHIAGEVTGNVFATERVELGAGCKVSGDVDAPVIVVEDGAVFAGRCRMPAPSDPTGDKARDPSVVPLRRGEPA